MEVPHPVSYTDILTDAEMKLGFQRVLVPNPNAGFSMTPNLVVAVVCMLNSGERIVKRSESDGTSEYQHQTFGSAGASSHTDWLPAQIPFPNPEDAIQSYKRGGDIPSPLNPRISPAAEVLIELQCPDCSEKFSLKQDYIALDDVIECPRCQKQKTGKEIIIHDK